MKDGLLSTTCLTAVFMLHPAYCQNEFKKQEGASAFEGLTPTKATRPYTYSRVLPEPGRSECCSCEIGDFTDELAFADRSGRCRTSGGRRGASTSALHGRCRLGVASISSTVETDWSIRGRMSRPPRLAQHAAVNAMVRLHHNIKLEHVPRKLETGALRDTTSPEPPPRFLDAPFWRRARDASRATTRTKTYSGTRPRTSRTSLKIG